MKPAPEQRRYLKIKKYTELWGIRMLIFSILLISRCLIVSGWYYIPIYQLMIFAVISFLSAYPIRRLYVIQTAMYNFKKTIEKHNDKH